MNHFPSFSTSIKKAHFCPDEIHVLIKAMTKDSKELGKRYTVLVIQSKDISH